MRNALPKQALRAGPEVRDVRKQTKLIGPLWLGWMILCAAGWSAAQTGSTLPIRVESNLVLVPVVVFDKERFAQPVTQREHACALANRKAIFSLPVTEAFLPKDCDYVVVRGLSPKEFHLFEDGVEQRIQSVTFGSGSVVLARDNLGYHFEDSETPAGTWNTTDLHGGGIVFISRTHSYTIAYEPPKSEKGNCHKIKIRVDHPKSVVYARDEYCEQQSPSDILNGIELDGIKLGAEMERDLASAKDGKIKLSLQAGFFYANTDEARVEIALEFPWDSLKREWESKGLKATIGVLGMVYAKGGELAERFSDFACCSSAQPHVVRGQSESIYQDIACLDSMKYGGAVVAVSCPTQKEQLARMHVVDPLMIPSRYEAQVELAPGEYDLRVVLSDGSKFGRAETPLVIDKYDGKQLALSSVMLCNRFRDARAAAKEAAAVKLAPNYVPLVSKGVRVTPAGDTRFKAGESLIPYFEVYEPLLAAQPQPTVTAHLRVVDVKTGQITKDFEPVDAAPYIQPGSRVIRIARVMAADQLPKGAYRMEVQVADSAGRSTPWRTANFTVE
jgi:hypothetical protein